MATSGTAPAPSKNSQTAVDDQRVTTILSKTSMLAKAFSLDETDFSRTFLRILRRWEGPDVTQLDDPNQWTFYKSLITAELNDAGWKDALEYPDVPLDKNLTLMAAEHYSFARLIAAYYGDPQTQMVVDFYYGMKHIAPEKMLRTSPKHPVLPESRASRAWAAKGVDKGLEDYKAAHGGKLGKRYSSRAVIYDNGPLHYEHKVTEYSPSYGKKLGWSH
jgi:hypothetical protein